MTWICPECKKKFRNRNQWHSCYVLSVEDHLSNKPLEIQLTVKELLHQIKKFGPININPVKSTIQVKSGATFLSINPKNNYIELEFQLGVQVDEFPIHKSIRISKNRVLHYLLLQSHEDITEQILKWLEMSYNIVSTEK